MAHMCIVVVLACFAVIALGASNNPLGWRIVGGSDAPEGAYPYQISLRRFGSHSCGGSIINKNWILTAAHCVDRAIASTLTVVVGTNKLSTPGTSYQVQHIIVHESYNNRIFQNDIALLKLSSDIEYSELVQPIKLETEDVAGDEPLVLTGWGRTNYPGNIPNALQHIKLTSISNTQCKSAHASINPVVDTQICTLTKAGEGACHGDSGGPLVHAVKKTQVGVVSWGIPCARNKPDVFTRVSTYSDWINKQISN